MAQSCGLALALIAVTAVWAVHGATEHSIITGSAVAAAASAAASKDSAGSACAKQCFAAAKDLGLDKVAGESLACFTPYKGKRLSSYDCCDKAELLLGAQGPLANCLCCPEFAMAVLDAVPYEKIGASAKDYLEKLHQCRVPILGQSTCQVSAGGTSATAPAGASEPLQSLTFIPAFNLSGLYPWVGFDARANPGVTATQGQAAMPAGQTDSIRVVGSSPVYNDFITGFAMWIERELPRYNSPKAPNLPPLPDQYKEDVAWVANLRRGPYPDLIKKQPEQYSPKATDPLQNGQIANLPPGPAYAGRLPSINSVAAAPAAP